MRLAAVAVLLLAASCTEVPRNVGGAAPTRTVTPTKTALGLPTSPTTPPVATSPARTPTPTPAPTATQTTSTPRASPTGTASPTPRALPSQPAEPTLPPGATSVFTGEQRFVLAPNAFRELDPAVLAREAGRTAPPCGSLFWTSAWHASEPLSATYVREGERTVIGVGRWGTTTLGCSMLELRNDGFAAADVRIVFTIASR